jgi:hypothetical protein
MAPVPASQTRTVKSHEPDTTRKPLDENATEHTSCV